MTDPESMRYLEEKKLRKRSLAKESMEKDNAALIFDFSGPEVEDDAPESSEGTDIPSSSATSGSSAKAGKAMASSAGQGETTADVLSSGMMASGNPYAMAAGAALKVMSARRKRQDAQAMMEYKADQQRKQRVVDQLALMSQQSTNLGLG